MKHLTALRDRLTPPGPRKWPWTAAAALLSGLAWAFLCWLVEGQSVSLALAALFGSDAGLWLTGLFFGLAVLALTLLLHDLFWGNAITGAAALILAFVNYYKVLITSTPLILGDLRLVGQVGQIAALNSRSLYLSRTSILALAGAAVWLLAALFFARPLRLPWKRSALGGLAAALAFLLLFWAGADAAIYRPLGIGLEQVRPQAIVNSVCGTPLGLWRAFLSHIQPAAAPGPGEPLNLDLDALLRDPVNSPAPTRPVGPESPEPAQPSESQSPEPAAEQKNPNIILILSESFFDITRLEGVSFSTDPLPEFHALQAEGVSGTFYTRSLGYGTSNIELEIMTGLNTELMAGENLYSCPPETFSRVPTVPTLLKENGYYTSLLHMFNDSIYHRGELFQYLGFDDMYFPHSFAQFYAPAAEAENYWGYMAGRISGEFYSDDLMSDLLIAQYETMSAQHDGPLFLYASSMENHQPYPADRYAPWQMTVDPVSSLTGEAADALRTYSQGAVNASAALGKLVDYFRTCPEPTIIVFYGDHRPGLGLAEGGTVYSKLGLAPDNIWKGTSEQFKELYSTDYVIWANDPSLLPGEPGSTWDTSCNYFGATLLNLARVELPTYWQLIDRLAQTRVADMFFFFLDREGNLSDEIAGDDPDAQRLAALRTIVSGVLAGTARAPD